jgi:hypothetical protein
MTDADAAYRFERTVARIVRADNIRRETEQADTASALGKIKQRKGDLFAALEAVLEREPVFAAASAGDRAIARDRLADLIGDLFFDEEAAVYAEEDR